VSLPNAILDKSSLTQKQLESLVSYTEIVTGGLRFKEAAARRSVRPVTIGSYYRTVQQGRKRVRESIVTILVAVAIGLVKIDDVRKLFELVGKGGFELPEEERERFSVVLQTLLDRIVM